MNVFYANWIYSYFQLPTGDHTVCRLAWLLGQPEGSMATTNPEGEVLRSNH